MGRSEHGGEKDRELAGMATEIIAAGRREGRQANDWRTFNESSRYIAGRFGSPAPKRKEICVKFGFFIHGIILIALY